MTTPRSQADVELLEKLVLGQLPVADAERLAVEYADDSRLVDLAEAASAHNDTLLDSLRNHQTVDDLNADQLVGRLVQRMKKSDSSFGPMSETLSVEASKDSAQAVPERLEYFQIQKVLGQGGMGTVYLADDTRLGRRVALKTLKRELAANPAAKDRFLREARSAARLEHDHIIPIYYVGEADGTPFLAMPFLQGEPLDSRLKREGADDRDPANQFARMSGEYKPLPIPEAIRIARQVALGLSVAHAQGLIHRDIKPANVWLEAPSGRVKILDFGLARSQTEAVHLTASGAIMGTPAYMAPEQARGKPVDARADLFSLGVMLYEMITGRRPFTGSDTMAILSSLALDEPSAPHTINSKCPAALSQLTMQLLAKQPEQRPASADVVAGRLARLEMPVVETVPPTQVTPAANPWATIEDTDSTEQTPRPARLATTKPRKRRLLPYLAVALLLGFVGIGLAFGGTIVRVANNEGELVVTVDDPNTEVVVKDGGVEIRREENGKKRIFLVKAGKNGEVEVREPGSDTVLVMEKFKVTRAGKVEVLVTAEKLAAARKNSEPDRKIAEYVLSIGGNVRLTANGKEVNPKAANELPRGPFELRIVDLAKNVKVNDAGLAIFKDCKELTHLFIHATPIGDAGLAHLKSCSNLTTLTLLKTKVTAQGIDDFKKALPNCKIEWDGGVIDPKESPDPDRRAAEWLLSIGGDIQIQKNGKTPLGWIVGALPPGAFELTGVTFYNGAQFKVSDAGLAHFKDCKNLTFLNLRYAPVTDAGLAYFKGCKNLTHLDLRNTQVSDAGLGHFRDCMKLTYLLLQKTKVTAAKIEELKKALPQCKIVWDGTTIEPSRYKNPFGMEFTLVPKGKSWLGGNSGKPGDKEVEFKNDFYLGVYTITQEQWQAVMGNDHAFFFARNGAKADAVKDIPDADLKRFPAERMTYALVEEFLAKLNKRDPQEGWVYRLPTGEEWEYACRGGPLADRSESAFSFYLDKPSNSLPPDQANYGHAGGKNRTVKVGQFRPNKLGLYDMHSNVLEWCSDVKVSPMGEPVRMVRGGSWNDPAGTASSEKWFLPTVQYGSIGIRVVRAPVAIR